MVSLNRHRRFKADHTRKERLADAAASSTQQSELVFHNSESAERLWKTAVPDWDLVPYPPPPPPFDATVYACLTTCFYATGRVGEFTVERISDQFDPGRSITPSRLSQVPDRDGNRVTNLRIPRTKVADRSQDVFWAKQNNEMDPEAALKNHRSVNDLSSSSSSSPSPLAMWIPGDNPFSFNGARMSDMHA
jgi:hypothetical protein